MMIVSPTLHVDAFDKKGKLSHKHSIKNCYYHGKLDGHQNSTVAMSTCNGLVSSSFFLIHFVILILVLLSP